MRYLILLLLNIPIIVLALLSILTKYKTKKITKHRFRIQTVFWITVLGLLIASFPVYNHLVGYSTFDSNKLTLIDIVQTTVIVYLVYSLTGIQQKLEQTNRRLQDLHQELSIRLSEQSNERPSKR